MKKLNARGMKVLKIVHILSAFLWVVGALSMFIILISAHPQTGDELFMRTRILQIIDDYVIITGANGAFLTGLVYGIWTNWGFFKHRWITFKWILTVLQMLFGTFMLGPRLNANVEMAATLRDAAFANPTFMANSDFSFYGGAVQTLLLVVMVAVSVLKPWKRKNSPARVG
ncbi:MAG: DUF2269 family protein [Mediterranea sp.]|nr:DUF2269 family protein [Mediterranea sp.]